MKIVFLSEKSSRDSCTNGIGCDTEMMMEKHQPLSNGFGVKNLVLSGSNKIKDYNDVINNWDYRITSGHIYSSTIPSR